MNLPTPHPIVPFDLNADDVWVPDLTVANADLTPALLADTAAFDAYVTGQLRQRGASVAVGGYGEDRVVYRRSNRYGDARSVHLGVDVWAAAGTPVFAPLPGTVVGVRDNVGFGNYGPTLVLRHALPGGVLHTLYGHLSRSDLTRHRAGDPVAAGATLAHFGPYPENGDWPPHLHFQLIRALPPPQSDYPGVCAPAERSAYLANCPNPNLILRSRWLA